MSTLKANKYQHVDRTSPSIEINSDGSVSIASTVTYEDVTSVDAVGLVTARGGLHVHAGIGVSIKSGGLNVTAGITTVQALQATTGTFSGAVSGTTGTFSGNLNVADSIVHSGNDNAKIRFPATDKVSIETGGTEVLNVDSSQRVNIGGVAVSQTRSLNIGSNAEANLAIETHNDATSETANIRFYKSGNTGASPQVVETDDNIAQLIAYGHDGTDYANAAASIKMSVDGAPGSNDMPGKIILSTTADGATSPSERLRITSAGDVGIGEATPDQKLHITDNTHPYIRTTLNDTTVTAGNVFGAWEFESIDSSTGCSGVIAKIDCIANAAFDGTAANGSAIRFLTSGTNSISLTERFRVTPTGAVSVGNNASPDGKLHVFSATAGTVTADADADELVLESSGNTGMSLLSPGTGESSIYFGNPGTNGQKDGWIKYYHETHSTTANRRNLIFATGGNTERLRIKNDGQVYIGGASGVTGGFGNTAWNLSVNNGSGDSNVLISGTTGAALELRDTVTSESVVLAANGDCNLYSYKAGDDIRFHNKPSGGSITERFRLHSNGQVTMGNSHTASSTHKMRVYQTGAAGGIELLGDGTNYAGQYVSGLSHETHCTTTENAKNAHMIYSSYHASKTWTYYFPHDQAGTAVRIHFPDNSTWVSGYLHLSSTFSYENASGLLTYSFTLNSNGTSNYNRHIGEETDLGNTDVHFSMSTGNAGYSFKGWADNGGTSSENTHALEIRRDGTNGGNHLRVTMELYCDAAANHIKKAYMTTHSGAF